MLETSEWELAVLLNLEFRVIRRDRLLPVSMEPSDRLLIASRVYALRESEILSPYARQHLSILMPPVVRRSGSGYLPIGNFRTIEICRSLPPGAWIGVLVLRSNSAIDESFLPVSDLVSLILDGLTLRYAKKPFLRLWSLCPEKSLANLSQEFTTRSGLERSLGLDRKKRIPAESEIQESIWG